MLSTDQGPLTALQERFVIDKKIFLQQLHLLRKMAHFPRKQHGYNSFAIYFYFNHLRDSVFMMKFFAPFGLLLSFN